MFLKSTTKLSGPNDVPLSVSRIFSFPDSFIFYGPRTTGGRRRAGEPEDMFEKREIPLSIISCLFLIFEKNTFLI